MLIPINTAAAGDTTLLAAVAGKRIRVHRAVLVNQVATAQPIKFRTGATDLHAAIPLPLAVGVSIEIVDPFPDLQTNVGELLAINLANATAVAGFVVVTLE
jgi:hypothetical protein